MKRCNSWYHCIEVLDTEEHFYICGLHNLECTWKRLSWALWGRWGQSTRSFELDKQTQKLISKHERNIKKNYKKGFRWFKKTSCWFVWKIRRCRRQIKSWNDEQICKIRQLEKSIQDSLNEVYKANKQEIYTNLKEVYKLNSEGVIKPLEKSISYLPNTRINLKAF